MPFSLRGVASRRALMRRSRRAKHSNDRLNSSNPITTDTEHQRLAPDGETFYPCQRSSPRHPRPMSKVRAIPEGYHTLTPYLFLREAAQAIEFYKKAFNATELMRMPGP